VSLINAPIRDPLFADAKDEKKPSVIKSSPWIMWLMSIPDKLVPFSGSTKDLDMNGHHIVNVDHLGVGANTVPDILLRVTGDNGSLSRIAMRGYSDNAASSSIRVTKFRGNASSPAVPNSGDSLGIFAFAGYSGLTADGLPGATLEAKTTETWTSTKNGTAMYLNVTATGAAGPSLAVTIDQDKSVKLAGAFACNGNTPQTKASLNANCTDLPSAIALLNQIRVALINNGIAQ
jgi:hypothetical protein